MANHAYVKTGKPLEQKEVDAHIRKIVTDKLKGLFEVEYSEKEKTWWVKYIKDDQISFLCWISDEREYGEMKGEEFVEYKKPKLVSKNSVVEFRHGHSFQFMWWVEGVVRENLGKIYNARMFDDGCEIDPTPNPDKYETFEAFCRMRPNGELKDDKETKSSKKMWLFFQLEYIPKDIVKTFNLDFKV